MPLLELLYRWLQTWLTPGSTDAHRVLLPMVQPVRVRPAVHGSTPASRRTTAWAKRSQPPRCHHWRG